jgi:ArsR family metal-binding transcriptional regulator
LADRENLFLSFLSKINTAKGEVLSLFFHLKNSPITMKHMKHVNFNTAVAHTVLLAVQKQWEKAGIATKRRDKIKVKILELCDVYRTLKNK